MARKQSVLTNISLKKVKNNSCFQSDNIEKRKFVAKNSKEFGIFELFQCFMSKFEGNDRKLSLGLFEQK